MRKRFDHDLYEVELYKKETRLRSSSAPRRLHVRLREAQHAAVGAPVYAKVSASGHARNRSNGHRFLLLRGDDADARWLRQV